MGFISPHLIDPLRLLFPPLKKALSLLQFQQMADWCVLRRLLLLLNASEINSDNLILTSKLVLSRAIPWTFKQALIAQRSFHLVQPHPTWMPDTRLTYLAEPRSLAPRCGFHADGSRYHQQQHPTAWEHLALQFDRRPSKCATLNRTAYLMFVTIAAAAVAESCYSDIAFPLLSLALALFSYLQSIAPCPTVHQPFAWWSMCVVRTRSLGAPCF